MPKEHKSDKYENLDWIEAAALKDPEFAPHNPDIKASELLNGAMMRHPRKGKETTTP